MGNTFVVMSLFWIHINYMLLSSYHGDKFYLLSTEFIHIHIVVFQLSIIIYFVVVEKNTSEVVMSVGSSNVAKVFWTLPD